MISGKDFFKLGFLMLGASAALLSSCARAPIKNREEAVRPLLAKDAQRITLTDDMNWAGLAEALSVTADRLMASAKAEPQSELQFGARRVLTKDYGQALLKLKEALNKNTDVALYVYQNFDIYEVYGTDEGWGQVFVTSYYTPLVEGRRRPEGRFTAPVWPPPKNLVRLRVKQFASLYPELDQNSFEDTLRDGVWRGQLKGQEVTPLPSRKTQRDSTPLLSKALLFLDPVDLFFMQIQGSGVVQFPKGDRVNLVYAEQNGHPYFPIGRALYDVIPKAEMSMQKIKAHLLSLPEAERVALMDQNPSYVYFNIAKEKSVTSFGVSAQPGRTIATDQRYFSKGALAFLAFPKNDQTLSTRFVLDHDTGGAIRGPGRLDLYWGEGPEAEAVSGEMKGLGRLYYLVPKESLEVTAKQ
jgi:membrane-bound lytic murein transglycosylase A